MILGGGAAGLMCAIEAGKRGRRVAVLEHADRLGKKILISGGGRCNFTNLHCQPENFLSANPHFAKSALARYTPADFIALVEKHRHPLSREDSGATFLRPLGARHSRTCWKRECRDAGVQHFSEHEDSSRSSERTDFIVRIGERRDFSAPALVVATGGLSIPKIGATAFGYDLARQFGLADPRSAARRWFRCVLNAEDRARYCDLAGVSAEVIASCGGQQFREKMLFTHRGLSGPAILQISSYWKKPEPSCIDLAPGARSYRRISRSEDAAKSDTPRDQSCESFCRIVSPTAGWICTRQPPGRITRSTISNDRLHAWTISPAGTEGYDKAEVTAGGVDTDELSAKTMECRKVPGLFFIGEVVDVTGHLGGFNFQWAWASGAAAGRALTDFPISNSKCSRCHRSGLNIRSHFGNLEPKVLHDRPDLAYGYPIGTSDTQRGLITMTRLIDEPEGWRHLQELAQREKDPQLLASIIDKMNRLLDRHQWSASTDTQPRPGRISDRATRLEAGPDRAIE